MTPAWDPRPSKAPDRRREPWTRPEQPWKAWQVQVARRGKPNTKRNLITYPNVLYRMYPDHLLTDLNEDDMRTFVDTIGSKCSRLMNGENPSCIRGLDITTCPIMHGRSPTTCNQYAALRIQSVWSYITPINQMYEWFRKQNRLPNGFNPMLPVMQDYRHRHRAEFDELTRDPNRRNLTLKEIQTLVKGSAPNHAVVYFMATKFFERIHEALRMSFEDRYCNLEEGWMILPAGGPDEPHKRKGNHDVILDMEAKHYLRTYRDTWWKRKVKRIDDVPVTHRVALTNRGLPFADNAEGNFNRQCLQKDAKRLGLMTGDEERGETITTHAFRAFACTWARNRQVPPSDEAILRGDLTSGTSAARYDDYRQRLPSIYEEYAPVLGL